MSQESRSHIVLKDVPRDFRTEIPNIVIEMIRLKLIPHTALTLYTIYRKVAGENGSCWIGTRGLAELCGMNVKTVTAAKHKLAQKFDILGGKSLIEITPGNKKEGHADTVVIESIWIDNYTRFKKIPTCGKTSHTPVVKRATPLCRNEPHKKEPIKKEPYKNLIIADPIPMAKTAVPPKPESMPAGGNNNPFVCLASCSDLSEAQKRQLSKYPESVVADAVRYCYHASVKLEGPQARIKQLHAFCKNPSAYSDTLKDLDSPSKGKSIREQILSVCKKGKMYNGFEFDYDETCLMLIDAPHNHVYSLLWKEKDLKQKWWELINKLGLK